MLQILIYLAQFTFIFLQRHDKIIYTRNSYEESLTHIYGLLDKFTGFLLSFGYLAVRLPFYLYRTDALYCISAPYPR